MSGKELNERWNVGAHHALYSSTGRWYHHLLKFPGAFFDSQGYILFETEDAYRQCEHLKLGKEVNIPTGIRSIPGYVQVVLDGQEYIPPAQRGRVEQAPRHYEGVPKQVILTRYERDRRARIACIEYYGVCCQVCGMGFKAVYGEAAGDFIHVHHLTPISAIGEQHEIDPVRDLRPVCPNCHAVIHQRTPPYSPEEVRRMLAQRTSCEQ